MDISDQSLNIFEASPDQLYRSIETTVNGVTRKIVIPVTGSGSGSVKLSEAPTTFVQSGFSKTSVTSSGSYYNCPFPAPIKIEPDDDYESENDLEIISVEDSPRKCSLPPSVTRPIILQTPSGQGKPHFTHNTESTTRESGPTFKPKRGRPCRPRTVNANDDNSEIFNNFRIKNIPASELTKRKRGRPRQSDLTYMNQDKPTDEETVSTDIKTKLGNVLKGKSSEGDSVDLRKYSSWKTLKRSNSRTDQKTGRASSSTTSVSSSVSSVMSTHAPQTSVTGDAAKLAPCINKASIQDLVSCSPLIEPDVLKTILETLANTKMLDPSRKLVVQKMDQTTEDPADRLTKPDLKRNNNVFASGKLVQTVQSPDLQKDEMKIYIRDKLEENGKYSYVKYNIRMTDLDETCIAPKPPLGPGPIPNPKPKKQKKVHAPVPPGSTIQNPTQSTAPPCDVQPPSSEGCSLYNNQTHTLTNVSHPTSINTQVSTAFSVSSIVIPNAANASNPGSMTVNTAPNIQGNFSAVLTPDGKLILQAQPANVASPSNATALNQSPAMPAIMTKLLNNESKLLTLPANSGSGVAQPLNPAQYASNAQQYVNIPDGNLFMQPQAVKQPAQVVAGNSINTNHSTGQNPLISVPTLGGQIVLQSPVTNAIRSPTFTPASGPSLKGKYVYRQPTNLQQLINVNVGPDGKLVVLPQAAEQKANTAMVNAARAPTLPQPAAPVVMPGQPIKSEQPMKVACAPDGNLVMVSRSTGQETDTMTYTNTLGQSCQAIMPKAKIPITRASLSQFPNQPTQVLNTNRSTLQPLKPLCVYLTNDGTLQVVAPDGQIQTIQQPNTAMNQTSAQTVLQAGSTQLHNLTPGPTSVQTGATLQMQNPTRSQGIVPPPSLGAFGQLVPQVLNQSAIKSTSAVPTGQVQNPGQCLTVNTASGHMLGAAHTLKNLAHPCNLATGQPGQQRFMAPMQNTIQQNIQGSQVKVGNMLLLPMSNTNKATAVIRPQQQTAPLSVPTSTNSQLNSPVNTHGEINSNSMNQGPPNVVSALPITHANEHFQNSDSSMKSPPPMQRVLLPSPEAVQDTSSKKVHNKDRHKEPAKRQQASESKNTSQEHRASVKKHRPLAHVRDTSHMEVDAIQYDKTADRKAPHSSGRSSKWSTLFRPSLSIAPGKESESFPSRITDCSVVLKRLDMKGQHSVDLTRWQANTASKMVTREHKVASSYKGKVRVDNITSSYLSDLSDVSYSEESSEDDSDDADYFVPPRSGKRRKNTAKQRQSKRLGR